MDLFSLVARLTLDDKDYEKTLKQAERKGKGAKIDAAGNISVTDSYSSALSQAERRAASADLDAQGSASLDTHGLAGDIQNAERATENADLDADGEAALDSSGLESDIGEAEDAVEGADLDAEGDAELDIDGLEGDVDEAEGIVDDADLDAEGEITLDTSDVQESLEDAQQASENFGTSFENVVDRLESKLRAAGIVAAIGGIATAFRNAIRSSADYADQVDKGAQRMAMSRHEYQQWDYVLSQNGASINMLERKWSDLSEAVAGSSFDWSSIGFDPSQYSTTAELFDGLMEALAGIDDESQRIDILTELFGPNGRYLNAVLAGGVEGLSELKQEAEDLGFIMSDEDIANGVAFGDALSRMQRAVDTLKNKIASELFPVLTEGIDLVTELLSGEADPEALESLFQKIIAQIPDLVSKVIDGLRIAIPQLVSVISTLFKNQEFIHSLLDLVFVIVKGVRDLLSAGVWSAVEQAYDAMFGEGSFQRDLAPIVDPTGSLGISTLRTGSSESQVNPMGTVSSNLYGATGSTYNIPEPGATAEAEWPEQLLGAAGIRPQDLSGVSAWVRGGGSRQGWVDFTEALFGRATEFLGAEPALWQMNDLMTRITQGYAGGIEAISQLSPEAIRELVNSIEFARTESGTFYGTSVNYTPEDATVNTNQADVNIGSATIAVPLTADDVAPPTEFPVDFPMRTRLHAMGLWNVPYDDYLASLHRDEMVLTASQAREYREGNWGGNADLVGAIQELRADMSNLKIFVGERAFGQTVVDYSGRRMRGYMGREENRQYAGYGWG